MREIVTATPAYRTFLNDCKGGKTAHCYIFASTDALLCDAFTEACVYAALGGESFDDLLWRKVSERTHADVLYFPREKKTFLTSEYDELMKEVGYAPIDGDKRVFVIDNADKIHPSLQSRMLKLLEEPPKGYVFILKVATTAPLLQTVISRARTVELQPLPVTALEQALRTTAEGKKATAEDVRWASEYAAGNVTTAVRLLSKATYRGMCEAVWSFFTTCAGSRDCLKWHDRWSAYEQNLDELLAFAAEAVRDVTAYLTAGEAAVNARDRLLTVKQVAMTYSLKACVSIADRIREAMKKIASYGNKKAIIDNLLLGICEDKAKYALPRG